MEINPHDYLFSEALPTIAFVDVPQPISMIDYKNNRLILTTHSVMGFCYDDIPFSIIFILQLKEWKEMIRI